MKLVKRSDWGAPATTSAPVLSSGIKGVAVHWLGNTYASRAHSQCAAYVRTLRTSHLSHPTENYLDIAYSFLVCEHGHVFEGRGLNRRPGANGNAQSNLGYYAICALHAKNSGKPSDALLNGLRDAIDYCRTEGHAGPALTGHRDHRPTHCPGDVLYGWTKGGAKRPERILVPITESRNPGQGQGVHTVKSGENLSTIAYKYAGIDWQDIARANNLKTPYRIYPGNKLVIPERTIKAYVPPKFPTGLGPNKTRPSAKGWQRVLKDLGFMPRSVPYHDNYGPRTQEATAKFHNKYTQFKSRGVTRDIRVGPKGWAFAHIKAYGGK